MQMHNRVLGIDRFSVFLGATPLYFGSPSSEAEGTDFFLGSLVSLFKLPASLSEVLSFERSKQLSFSASITPSRHIQIIRQS